MKYREYWEQIYDKSKELNSIYSSYWNDYSSFGSWQFWVVVFLMIFPLILLYFVVDKKRIFELFFFGYTVHILWAYIDIFLERNFYFVHTYFISPDFPYALNMTASALPVGFLLLYQYCINHKKNFYLYTIGLSVLFAFILLPIEVRVLKMAMFNKGFTYFYIFLIDIGIAYTAYWFTKIIKKIGNKSKQN